MNNRNRILVVLAAAAVLAGCASPRDNVIFVTKTSLGIDVDGTPVSATIAYDRVEGYLGPRFENGTVPPVVAKISTNGGLFDRNIKQYYATGTAANLLTGSAAVTTGTDLEGVAEPMFFGTSTTLGLKIGFTTTVPDSLVLGYRRKELSLIPIGVRDETTGGVTVRKRAYPSVIGVFSNDFKAGTTSDTQFGLAQFFATGTAAEALAGNQDLKNDFQKFARDAVEELKDAIRLQQETALGLVKCFTRIADAKVVPVLDNANALKLFLLAGDYDDIKATAATDMHKARADYVSAMSIVKADSPDRGGRLEGHRVYVCGLI